MERYHIHGTLVPKDRSIGTQQLIVDNILKTKKIPRQITWIKEDTKYKLVNNMRVGIQL